MLEEMLVLAHKTVEKKEKKGGVIAHDAELTLDQVNEETFRAIDILAPFGEGNPKPIFLFRKARIHALGGFGKQKNHLKLIFESETGLRVTAIGFFMSITDFPGASMREGGTVDLSASFEKSYFRGRPELRLRICAIS